MRRALVASLGFVRHDMFLWLQMSLAAIWFDFENRITQAAVAGLGTR
jgi:hypothetical protein